MISIVNERMKSDMKEFDFIDSIKQKTYRNQSIIMGIGDDGAVFRQTDQDMVTAVDTFVDGVHFTKRTMSAFQIGYRALAANISDMAAMGADPVSYLVSIVVPKNYSDNELKEIYQGLDSIAEKYQVDLIGGDTVTGDQLVLSVTINGALNPNKVRYRHSMKPNDYIFVTGTLGDSAAGLDLLIEGHADIERVDYLIDRHRMPTPRINFSKGLENIDRIALNDISDGLASEANELAQASKLTIYLEESTLPISKELEQFTRKEQIDYILNGGEDFELVGSVAPENWAEMTDIARHTNTPIKKIGYVTDEVRHQGKVFLKNKDEMQQLKSSGYVHEN